MSARIYHFCQRCQQTISPRINDDAFKAQQAELVTGLRLMGMRPWIVPTGHHVWTYQCPKCGHDWRYKLLRVGREPIARIKRVTTVLGELQVGNSRGHVVGQRNYKKLQHAKSRRGNSGAGAAYARRKYETRKALEGIDKW